MSDKVLLDANVLYSQPLRMMLLNLANLDECSVQLFWTDKIDAEWTGALNRNHPEGKESVISQVKSIKTSFFDCYVLDYEPLIELLELPDPNDRHVLAAAIKTGCNIIATDNIKHFPAKLLAEYGIRTMTRDELMCFLFTNEKDNVMQALDNFARVHKDPKLTVEDLLIKLERSVPSFTHLVRES
ncbi:PIN domain-containing protein [Marinomonas sp. M1K-6]|uniref:PIN domain-containing protein n=1 Tax=Marinomonas profundi TaxID=2726122 RepID=A0A847QVN1_9GAMM|nr:PIN domain-containing protein [Marinomonas profundi]NLQ17078.1 PIN domain-containing protein [Marinomonas profundi]UDV04723.1 PIN domain-containing protein [Marinomonas profundi]